MQNFFLGGGDGGKQGALWEYESSEWAAIMKVAWVLIDKSGFNADTRELDIVRLCNDSLIKLVLVSHRFAGKSTSWQLSHLSFNSTNRFFSY